MSFKKTIILLIFVLFLVSGCNADSIEKSGQNVDNSTAENHDVSDNQSNIADFEYSRVIDHEASEGIGRIGFDHIGVSIIAPERAGVRGVYFGKDSVTFSLAGLNKGTLDKISGTEIALEDIPEHLIDEGRNEAIRRNDGEMSMQSLYSDSLRDLKDFEYDYDMVLVESEYVLIDDTPAYYFEYLFESPHRNEDGYPLQIVVFRGYVFTYEGDTYCLTVQRRSLARSDIEGYYTDGELGWEEHYHENMLEVLMSLETYNGEAYEEIYPDYSLRSLFRGYSIIGVENGDFYSENEDYYFLYHYHYSTGNLSTGDIYDGELRRLFWYDDEGEIDTFAIYEDLNFDEIQSIDDIMPFVLEHEIETGEIVRTEEVTINGIDMIKSWGAAQRIQDDVYWSVWIAYSFMIEEFPCYIIVKADRVNPIHASDEMKKTHEYRDACWEITELYANTIIRTIRLMDADQSHHDYR